MIDRTQCKHPVIVINGIDSDDFEALLNYMYLGEVNILQNRISRLVKAAEYLKIKGLAIQDDDPISQESRSTNNSNKRNGNIARDSPQPKRRRQSEDERRSRPTEILSNHGKQQQSTQPTQSKVPSLKDSYISTSTAISKNSPVESHIKDPLKSNNEVSLKIFDLF